MKKKLISVLLCAAMIAGLAVGCGSSGGAGEGEKEKKKESAEEPCRKPQLLTSVRLPSMRI